MAVRKDKFKDHVAVAEGLDIVEEDEQITHLISLEEVTPASAEDMLSTWEHKLSLPVLTSFVSPLHNKACQEWLMLSPVL